MKRCLASCTSTLSPQPYVYRYGEAYKESLVKHCSTLNIQIDAFPVFMHGTGMETGINNQMVKLKKLGLNVFVLVGFGSGMKVCGG